METQSSLIGKQLGAWVLRAASLLVLGLAPAGVRTEGAHAAEVAGPSFPLRARHPELEFVSLEQARAAFGRAVFVDTRSKCEFDVLHIEGAVHVPAAKLAAEELERLRGIGAVLIFYCNGPESGACYRAAETARGLGFREGRVFDGGVLAWCRAEPARSVFFGKQLSHETLAQSLIPRAQLDAVCLDSRDFVARAKSGEYKLFDVRERGEWSWEPIKLPGIVAITLDELVALLEKDRGVPPTKLLFLDSNGKAVQWLQYHLERAQKREYFFLRKGATQLFKDGFDASGNLIR